MEEDAECWDRASNLWNVSVLKDVSLSCVLVVELLLIRFNCYLEQTMVTIAVYTGMYYE